MNTQQKHRDGRDENERPKAALAVAFLSAAFLGLASDEPTPPVPFEGMFAINDGTHPPEGNIWPGLSARSLSHGTTPRLKVTNPPVELDKQFQGLLCWDAFCSSFVDPPPFDAVEFHGSLTSTGTYFCETGPGLCSTAFQFYFRNSDIVACPNSGCVKPVDVRFYSRFGTVKGRVTLRDGTPAIGRTVRATDPEGKLKPVTTNTDAYGFYDFSASFAPVEPEHPAYGKVYPPVPIDPTNHWGLTVYGDGGLSDGPKEYVSGSRGQKEWRIQASSAAPAVIVNVLGGEVSIANFVIPLPDEEDDPDKQDCFSEGEPVSIMTGNVFFHQTDVVMNDLRGPFAFIRTYNSQNAYRGKPAGGIFGPGWSHAFESKLSFPTSYRGIVLSRSNGTPVYYTDPEDDGSYHAYLPLTEQSRLVRSADAYTRFLVDGSREVFDAEGRLISQVDSTGGVTRLEYDGSRLARVIAPSGRSLSLEYGSDALYLSGPEGVAATYRFEGGRLDRVDYPDGSGFRFTYDDRWQLLVMLDATGRVVERHSYEDDRAVTSEIGEGQERFTFRYDPTSTTVTDPLGNESVYEFSEIHEDRVLTRVTGPCAVCGGTGQARQWTYDERARVVAFSDGPGIVTRYTYDAQGNVLTVTNPTNETTTFTYDAQGRVLSRLDPDGALTTFTYGPFGILTATDPLQRTTTVAYDARGLPASLRNAQGGLYELRHNDFGDLTEVVDPLGNSILYERDAMGRRIRVSDETGVGAQITYDPRGRLQRVTRGDGSFIELSYDRAGRRTFVSDATGARTSYLYDTSGRLASIVDPMTGLTTLEYDSASNVTAVRDPRGSVTRFQYDAFQRVTGISYPDGASESFLYDEAGRLTSHTDRKGTVATFLPDALGRVVRKSYSDGTPAVSFSYDAAGRLVRAENGADTLTWTYDPAGQLSSERSERNQSTLEYTYDALGSRLSLHLDSAVLMSYEHDPVSMLRSLTVGPEVFRFQHDEGYRRTALTLPSGVTTTYDYDPASRPRQISVLSGANPIVTLGYSYDPAGRATARSTSEMSEIYSYDALGRLTSVDRTGADVRHWSYAFDASGNRTVAAVDRNVTTSFYNSGNELDRQDPGGPLLIRGELTEPGTVTIDGEPAALLGGNRFEATLNVPSGTSTVRVIATDGSGNVQEETYEVDIEGTRADFRYDANGNLVERTEGLSTWSYEWNGENELTRVLRDGVEVARFSYDPLGRRVEQATALATTSYTYDENRILRESTAPGETIVYVHGPQIDEPLAAMGANGTTFYHVDALGSVVGTSNASGERTSSRRYDPFGNPEEAIPNGYAYTGREWDAETGLYYYRARYYDPRSGRFLSEDPTFFEGGMNLYAYVGGNPVNLRDPNGTGWLGDAFDSVTSAWNGIQEDKSYKAAKKIARMVKKMGEAVECLKEQFECEDRNGKPCRCNKYLDAAGRADCELRVTEKCTADSIPCYVQVLVPSVFKTVDILIN